MARSTTVEPPDEAPAVDAAVGDEDDGIIDEAVGDEASGGVTAVEPAVTEAATAAEVDGGLAVETAPADLEQAHQDPTGKARAEPPAVERSQARPRSWPARVGTVAGLVLLATAGTAIAAWKLDAKPVWLDEGISLAMADAGWRGFRATAAATETNMVGHYLLLRGWMALGEGAVWARLLSAGLFGLAIPAMVLLARRMFGAGAGWMAGALFASAPMAIGYAREIRGYTLLLLAVTVAAYALVGAVRTPSLPAWCRWGVACGLLVYVHLLAAFSILAMLLALAFRLHRLPLRQVAAGLGVALALASPLVVTVVTNATKVGHDGLAWVQPPRSAAVLPTVGRLVGGEAGWLLPGAFALLALVALVTRRRWETLLALSLALVPIAANYLVSVTVQPIWIDRYLMGALPGIVLLAAAALGAGTRRWVWWLAWPALAGLVAANLSLVPPLYEERPDRWEQVASTLVAASEPGDGLIVITAGSVPLIDRHAAGRAIPDLLYPALPSGGNLFDTYDTIRVPLSAEAARAAVASRDRVWVVYSHAGTLTEHVRVTREALCGAGFRIAEGNRRGFFQFALWERRRPGGPAAGRRCP